jgi:hypothetical protein
MAGLKPGPTEVTYVRRGFSRTNSAFYQRTAFSAGYSARNFS